MQKHYRMTMDQPAYMFRACTYGREKITRVKVIKLTPKTLTYEQFDWRGNMCPQSERIESHGRAAFPTWEEARDWLLQRAEGELEVARRCLQVAQSTVGNIKGMKKPEHES
jgi:hypothetical protein